MYYSGNVLAQEVKREVLADLQGKGYLGSANYQNSFGGSPYWQERQFRNYDSIGMYQTIKDSVKNEVLAEIELQQMDRVAQLYGLDRALSDRGLKQLINDRYRQIDNLKSEIKRELLAFQRMEARRSPDPYVREIAGVLAEEGQRRGIPLEQLIAGFDQKPISGLGMMGRISNMLNTGQRKGFLCGLGTALLCYFLLPTTRNNMRSIAVRSFEEGLSMVDRAKTFMNEQCQQNPSAGFVNFEPEPPQGS